MEESGVQLTPREGYSEVVPSNEVVPLSDIKVTNVTVDSIKEMELVENILLFMGISLGAYVGSFIRIGISYYKIWRIETNYCVMYTEIIGSILMGLITRHKHHMVTRPTATRFSRVMFVTLTTGLCGSITTFSSWQMECNKNFVLQWDVSWGGYHASHNGGRLIEWVVSLWVGVALPMMALRLGQHISLNSSYRNDVVKIPEEQLEPTPADLETLTADQCTVMDSHTAEWILVAFYVVSTVLVIVLPVVLFPTWVYLTYTALFGVVGAYVRYQLSFMNAQDPNFPRGTFAVNIAGTWILAALTVLSKFVVDYHDVDAQGVLSGLEIGFCGCLTTISTFVNEIDVLPIAASYRYGLASNLVAQLGVILILNVYSYRSVSQSSVAELPGTVNLCTASHRLCDVMLTNLACPTELMRNTACSDSNDYSTYIGMCGCGEDFTTTRISSLMVDSQVRSNFSQTLVSVWPTQAEQCSDPSLAFDACLSFQNMCDHYLSRINCPQTMRIINGCNRRGILHSEGRCECGPLIMPGQRIQQVLTDMTLNRRNDLTPFSGYVTLQPFDFASAYEEMCDRMLDYVQCPDAHRHVHTNSVDGDYATWSGECACGSRYTVNTEAVAFSIFSSVVKPQIASLLVGNSTSYDMCGSYVQVCGHWLTQMSCPAALQQIVACGPSGTLDSLSSAMCACGAMTLLSEELTDFIIDAVVAETLNNEFWYFPPPGAPYSAMVASDPTKQLMIPLRTIPV